MLDAEEVVAVTSHPVGGVCPFGLPARLPVYCDVSLKPFDEVVPAAGATNAAVRLSPDNAWPSLSMPNGSTSASRAYEPAGAWAALSQVVAMTAPVACGVRTSKLIPMIFKLVRLSGPYGGLMR